MNSLRRCDRPLGGIVLVLVCVLACMLPRLARAQEPSPKVLAAHESFDAKLLEELGARSPDVREQWRRANEASEAGDFEQAVALYSEVLDAHGDFHHALRRRCNARVLLEQFAEAQKDCEAAYELEPGPENATALAMVLVELGDRSRALELAQEGLRGEPDFINAVIVCQIALTLEDTSLLGRCSTTLRHLDTNTWEAQFFSALHSGMVGELDEGRRQLDRAHELGLDDEPYEELSAMFEQAESPVLHYLKKAGWIALLWISVATALIAAGFALSRLTLAEAESALTNPKASAHARDSWLRKAYAWVLWACCAYYYLSVPLVLLSVVALGAAIVLLFLYIGRIPIKLLVIVAVIVFGSLAAVIKSFFTRPSDEPPGEALDLSEAPGLRKTLDEVAAKVGTRPVDRVYLEVGADIAVFERGSMLDKLRGKGERCLLLGVAVLDGMDTQAFKAILAHEYGHFSNEDTAGGNLALGVRRSVVHSAVGLAQAGAAGWYNPAWLFLQGFHRVFLRISQGASRLQEVLADRWSARCYGADSFERGLRHVIAADMRFDAHANASLREILERQRGLRNIYSFSPSEPPSEPADIERRVEEAIDAEPSPYDSHPRPADRFRWAHAIALDEDEPEPEQAAAEPAWGLFASRASIEERMTEVIRGRVAEQTGVRIPVVDSHDSDSEGEGEPDDPTGDDSLPHQAEPL